MNEPIPFLTSPGMSTFALIIIGGLAGWIAGVITGMRHGILTNILVGVAGSYVGQQLAELADVAVRGRVSQLVAAVVGAIVVTYIWQMLRGRAAT